MPPPPHFADTLGATIGDAIQASLDQALKAKDEEFETERKRAAEDHAGQMAAMEKRVKTLEAAAVSRRVNACPGRAELKRAMQTHYDNVLAHIVAFEPPAEWQHWFPGLNTSHGTGLRITVDINPTIAGETLKPHLHVEDYCQKSTRCVDQVSVSLSLA